jgi:hypothetical protein
MVGTRWHERVSVAGRFPGFAQQTSTADRDCVLTPTTESFH